MKRCVPVLDPVAPEAAMIDSRLASVLKQPLYRRDRPTETHYTLEIAAYWEDDFLDAVRSGVRRKLTIGGLRSAGRNNLAVELHPPLIPYTVAHIRGREADIVFPAEAEVARRLADGTLDLEPAAASWRKAPFEAKAVTLRFHESLAFRVGTLTFLLRYVHRDGRPRHVLDWVPAKFFAGYMG